MTRSKEDVSEFLARALLELREDASVQCECLRSDGSSQMRLALVGLIDQIDDVLDNYVGGRSAAYRDARVHADTCGSR